mgnify:FL=1
MAEIRKVSLAISQREQPAQNKLIKGLERAGWYVQKTEGRSRNGFPDVTAITPEGVVWFLEVKRERGGVLSARQQVEMTDIASHKANAAIIIGVRGADAFVQGLPHSFRYKGIRVWR